LTEPLFDNWPPIALAKKGRRSRPENQYLQPGEAAGTHSIAAVFLHMFFLIETASLSLSL
jgi:hypothetical protein